MSIKNNLWDKTEHTTGPLLLVFVFSVCTHSAASAVIFSPQNYRYISSFHLSPSFILAGHSLTFLRMCNNVLFTSSTNISPVFIGHSARLYAKNPTIMALQSLVPILSSYSTTQERSTDGFLVLRFLLSVILCSLRCITDNTYASHPPFHVTCMQYFCCMTVKYSMFHLRFKFSLV